MNKANICPKCKRLISTEAKTCKHCFTHVATANLQTKEAANGYKFCPYCDEEIRIDAKKCHHCCEWISKKPLMTTPSSFIADSVDANMPLFIYNIFLLLTCFVYLDPFELITNEYVHVFLKESCLMLWILSIMIGMRNFRKRWTPTIRFIWLFIMQLSMIVCSLYIAVNNIAVDFNNTFSIVYLVLSIFYVLSFIVLGRYIRKNFYGHLRSWGGWLIAYPIVLLVLTIAESFIEELYLDTTYIQVFSSVFAILFIIRTSSLLWNDSYADEA